MSRRRGSTAPRMHCAVRRRTVLVRSNHTRLRRCELTALVALVMALFPGCKRVPAAQAPPPPMTVTVSRPLQRDVIRWDEYSGYLSSPQTVTVDARVSGLIEEA